MDLLAKLLGKKVFIVDIEAKGLLDVVHTFDDLHVLSYGYWENDDWKIGSTKNRGAIKRLFENPDNVIIGHFFLGYDIRALKKMIPEMEVKAFIIDTLTLSQYLYNERSRHGLEDWGVDLGYEKVEISDEEWATLSYEKAVERCERDVLINCLLWAKIEKFLFELYAPDYKSLVGAIKRCNFKNTLLSIQDDNRILLDVEKCKKNLTYLEGIIKEKIEDLKKILPKVPIKATKNKPKNMYKKDGSYSKAGIEWLSLLERAKLPLDYEGSLELIKGYDEPNPTSNQQLKDYLFSKNWKPKIFKDGANGKVPQLRDDNKNLCSSILELIEETPELESLQGLSVAQHRAKYLKAFLDTKDENDCVTAGWTGIAKTFRVKHNKPIVNLPSNSSQYGELVRSCLIAPPGKVFVNADMSSLEDKTKQCCIYPYDPKYVESLNQPGYDAHLTIALLGGFMDQEDVDFYKWFSDSQGVGEGCPDKYKGLSVDEMKIQYKSLSKIRKSSKVVNYSCLPTDNTEVLTEAGWKWFKDLSFNDKVLSYNVENDETEFCKIKNTFLYQNAEVISMENKWWKIESTLNHRWYGKRRTGRGHTKRYVNEFFITDNIKTEHSILNSAKYAGGGLSVSDKEASLLGWVLSDGFFKWSEYSEQPSTSKGAKRFVKMSIAQSKSKFYEELKSLLQDLGFKYGESENNSGVNVFTVSSSDARRFLQKFGIFGTNKHEVDWETIVLNMNQTCLESFFTAFHKGDGYTKNVRNNSLIIYQNDGKIKDAVSLAGFLLGYKVTTAESNNFSVMNFSPNRYTSGQRFKKQVSRTTEVFCLETENSTFVVRQNGVITITGNCTYGASAKKVAESGDMTLKEATTLRDAYWNLNWSVKKFSEDLETKDVQGKTFIWNPYTKLWLLLTSDHIKFSACNQNFGMCVFELFVYYLIEEGVKPIMTIHK